MNFEGINVVQGTVFILYRDFDGFMIHFFMILKFYKEERVNYTTNDHK